MRILQVLFATALLVGQLPLPALVLNAAAAPTTIGAAELNTVTGGVCNNCKPPMPPGKPPVDETPYPTDTYWEAVRSERLSVTTPGYQTVWSHVNAQNQPIQVQYTRQERESISWTVTGGLPANILSAQFGSQGETVTSSQLTVQIPARHRFTLLSRQPVERWRHSYTRWQEYSDGSRQSIGSSTVHLEHSFTQTMTRMTPN